MILELIFGLVLILCGTSFSIKILSLSMSNWWFLLSGGIFILGGLLIFLAIKQLTMVEQ